MPRVRHRVGVCAEGLGSKGDLALVAKRKGWLTSDRDGLAGSFTARRTFEWRGKDTSSPTCVR